MEQNIQSGAGNALLKKLGLLLSVLVFLLPVFFIPAGSVGLFVGKTALLAVGLVAVFAVFLSMVLFTGTIEIPKAKYLIPIFGFAIVALISSILTGNISASLAGDVFDFGTSGSVIILVFALLMVILSVRNLAMVNKIISAFTYSAMVAAVYSVVVSLSASHLPASIASRIPLFPIGGAIDTAIILGAAIILSLCALNMTEISDKKRYAILALVVLSVLFVGATNFMPVVVVLGVVSLVFFAYILSWSFGNRVTSESAIGEESLSQNTNRKVSLSSLVVLIAMVVFILGGATIGGFLSDLLKIQSAEIRPNFQTTMSLSVEAWKQNFAFGIGPNRFVEFWAANKPIDINQTQFWASDFYSGSGFIPTAAITTGLLGLLSLLAFLVMYIMTGVKAIFAQANAGRSRYLATASFLVSIYLWIMLFVYTPSISVLALTFIFTGLFTATLVPQGIVGILRVNVFANPKTNFLSVLATIILLVLSVAGGYFVFERVIAATIFQGGIIKYQTTGDTATAKIAVSRAINLVSRDVYWRGLAEIYVSDFGKSLSGITSQSQITEDKKTEIQTFISNSIESAKKATEIDKDNFQNWFALGRVYEILAQNGIAGSIDSARAAYNEAKLRSPRNPSVPLALARLYVLEKNVDAARSSISEALVLKNNYSDAYYALAQLEASVNNVPQAIKSVEALVFINPNDSGLLFQLGILKYDQKDYLGAVAALERSVYLIPDYANAKYFLGLSYYQLGRKEDAVKQFEDLKTSNPGNQDIEDMLSKIKSGKSLFSGGVIPNLPIK